MRVKIEQIEIETGPISPGVVQPIALAIKAAAEAVSLIVSGPPAPCDPPTPSK